MHIYYSSFFIAYFYEGSVASRTSRPQYALFFAFFRAVWKPMLMRAKSFITVDFHVERGLPFGRFHDRGTPCSESARRVVEELHSSHVTK